MCCWNVNDSTLYELVCALCADYGRRACALSEKSVSHRTEMEYRYYNFKIFEAAAEIAGDTDAERFIFEIGRRTGYASTALDNMSEVTYKKKKRAVIENIAKRLHLADQ